MHFTASVYKAIIFLKKKIQNVSNHELYLEKLDTELRLIYMLIRNFTQGFSLYIITQQSHRFAERDQEVHST
tara:strand:- start:60 stop:275 length:216 start_codon:yes stop_codon:yes gene_type:complete